MTRQQDESHTDQLVNRAVALRLAALRRITGFQENAYTLRRLRRGFRRDVSSAIAGGVCESWVQGESSAHLLRYGTYHPYFCCTIDHLVLDYTSGCLAALRWLGARVREQARTFSATTTIDICASYDKLLPILTSLGMAVEATILLGDVPHSLAALAPIDADAAFAAADCEVRPLRTKDEVDAVVELKARIFAAAPRLCWFYQNEGHQQVDRNHLLSQLDAIEPCHRFLITRSGAILGMFGFDRQSEPFWGRTAGMDFAFDPVIQGHGLGTAAYKSLFLRMAEHGFEKYMGGTSNPAVLKLAQRFSRWPITYHLRYRPKA